MNDKLIVICALILAAVYAWMTEQVTVLPFGDPLGPRAFPRILTIALLVAVVLLVFEMSFSKADKRQASPSAEEATGDNNEQGARDTRWVVVATVAATALYFFLFEPLGFVISSSAYLLAMMSYFNRGKTVANVLVALLVPVTCYLIFSRLLGVDLARGIFPI